MPQGVLVRVQSRAPIQLDTLGVAVAKWLRPRVVIPLSWVRFPPVTPNVFINKAMLYTIIEDCSPYYIRFTYDGIDDFITHAAGIYDTIKPRNGRMFNHVVGPSSLLERTPLAERILFNDRRVSYFVSKPGLKYPVHKDGVSNRWSINYTIRILDDRCITRWWSDEDGDNYQLTHLSGPSKSRELPDFDTQKHQPLKTMTAKQGECILFNTDIFHDWDNSRSLNERVVLTLHEPNPGKSYFEDIREILFGRAVV